MAIVSNESGVSAPRWHHWQWWQQWPTRLANRLGEHLPGTCLVCQRWPSPWLCSDCAAICAPSATGRCDRCALPLPGNSQVCPACLLDPLPLRHCHAAVDYSPPWNGMVQQFKYHQHLAWARPMAQLTLQAPHARQWLQRADLVLAVPLSAARLRERGYNQALQLARALQHQAPSNAALHTRWLLRLADTPAQAQLGRAARLRNLRHAFAVEPRRAAAIRGRQVLLVDDVMTTGATLAAVANMLLAHGASAVDAMVFARTPLPE